MYYYLFSVTNKLEVCVTALIFWPNTSRMLTISGNTLQIKNTSTTIISITASLTSFFSCADMVDKFLLDLLTSKKINKFKMDRPPKGRTYMKTKYIQVM